MLALSVIAFAAVMSGAIRPHAGLKEAAVAPGAKEQLAKVKTVHGKPVTTVRRQGHEAKAVAGELLVKIPDPKRADAFGSALHKTSLPQTYRLEVSPNADLSAETDRVAALAGVTAVNPNYIVTATVTPNDTLYAANQWNLPKISAPAAWDRTTGSSSTVIASLDTGVNFSHQDLSAKIFTNAGEIPGNGIDDDGNGYADDDHGMDFVNGSQVGSTYFNDANGAIDDAGHGTLTASIFAASTNNNLGIAGVDWQAKILPVKVLDSSGSGTFVDVAAGIHYASLAGAKVINLSLGAAGVTSDFATDDAITYATGRGTVLVAASGNDSDANNIDYPAINPNVIAVGATNQSDVRASFSNGGPQLSVVAPGTSITGAGLANTAYTSGTSGTSVATPHVAGLAGLLASTNSQITPARVRQLIEGSADKVAGMNGANRTNLYGYGRINAQRTLAAQPSYSAEFKGFSGYPTVASGDQTTVYVDYKNVGELTWSSTGPNPTRLGTSHALGRSSPLYTSSWIGPGRAATFSGRVESGGSVTATGTIQPGETARFSFTITGPPVGSQQVFREYFQPLVEGITWMEDYGVFFDVTVPARTYTYSVAGFTNPPPVMQFGARNTVTLDLTNTGSATWRQGGAYPFNLGTTRPRGRPSAMASGDWQSLSRVKKFAGVVSGGVVTAQDFVPPGQTARFSFDFVAPGDPGNYLEYFEPLVENYQWLGDVGIFWQVYVPDTRPSVPLYDYAPTGFSPWPTINRGEQTTLKFDARNMGRATWHSDGSTPVRLGTDRPRGRADGFSNNGTAPGWISDSRVKLTRNLTDPSKDVGGETSINPGEIGEFEFAVFGAPPPGSYDDYLTPLAETLTWMPDRGVFWRVTVQQPVTVGLAQQSSATLSSDGSVRIRNEAGQLLDTAGSGGNITLSWNGSQYTVTTPTHTVNSASAIRVEQDSINNVATVSNLADNGSNNRFRGNFILKNGSPGTWLVNEINLEEYLRGLGEVPDSWPAEAIKAQVVAARTYAARRISNPQNSVFNIYDDTRDQTYNGYNNEIAKPNHVAAIAATRGVAIYKSGALIQAYYATDSGGATENNENVWGGAPIDYLRGVADPYEKPDIWSKTVSNATIQANYGHTGNVDAIAILETYPSGRIKTIRLTTSGGAVDSYTLPADTQRNKLTLRSSRVTSIGRNGNDWVFNGRGFGHGIGMGQWGAFNQANAGRNYIQILTFYYTGIALGNLY